MTARPAAEAATAGCFDALFVGIPQGRLAPVEAGTTAFDIVTSSEPKAGPIGLRFTDHGRTIGGIKVTWYPVNEIFRVESVVDARCRRVGDYADVVDRGQNDRHAELRHVADPAGGGLLRTQSQRRLVAGARHLIAMGVYPFVVPYPPLVGALGHADGFPPPPPSHELVADIIDRVARVLRRAGMRGADQEAGCAACGACSALSSVGG